jgi:RNA polymerase sigma-70 factor, ECF subfamily
MTTVALSPGTAGLEYWNEQEGKAGSTIETALPGSAAAAANRVTTTSVARGPIGPTEKPEKPLEKAVTSGEKSGGVTAGVPNEEQDPVIVSGEDAEDLSQRGVQGILESQEGQVGQRSQEGQIDDHALLAATRAGDETAFQEIVRRYRNQITNYVYRMTSDYDRAVDIAQETFVRVYMNIDRYQATFSFSTYIYRIAHNLAITELRQRKRRRLIPLPTFFSDKDSEELEVELPDQRQIMADDAMITEERRLAVTRAIASLPEKYRAALVLCDLEEKSYEEISEVLGLPTGTVKSRINRARNLLKEKLRDIL